MGRRFKETDTLLHYVDESVRLAGGFTPIDLFPSSLLVRVLTLRRAVRRVEDFRESLVAFMNGVVREHLERKKSCGGEEEAHDQEDLVDVLLRIQQEGNLKFPLTMSIIEEVIFDLIAGGIETAASTLQWVMAELMRNPAAMSKAQPEVRGVYTGQTKDPETFDPERFVGDARDFRGNDFEFTPFGAGRRIWPGMAFGMANYIELGLASLLFYFDWSLPEGVVPSEMDMTETMGITAR
ncbi:unnamed protein product [Miscanthus lutarioriparius]|uniref:Cytochrome P450 n=1 Tax=Miscanthus lutarioriparius TaxID=422564 RepID=A0A811RI78_9POAL|nr:unnamed protein product [Miscanthus lutarioriparius]